MSSKCLGFNYKNKAIGVGVGVDVFGFQKPSFKYLVPNPEDSEPGTGVEQTSPVKGQIVLILTSHPAEVVRSSQTGSKQMGVVVFQYFIYITGCHQIGRTNHGLPTLP